MNRPFSESCEQNKHVIYEAIQKYLLAGSYVLEIGTGTAQHAVYFAEKSPQIYWQTSDREMYLSGIQSWLDFANLSNILPPITLNVSAQWPDYQYDLVFTANSLHIMDHQEAEQCIKGAARVLKPGGYLLAYGPYNYEGCFTSESNCQFDGWLRQQNLGSCIKDFEWLDEIASIVDLQLVEDIVMPANNRLLVWQHETLSAG